MKTRSIYAVVIFLFFTIAAKAQNWVTTGNTGASPGKLGTTDTVPLRIIAGNTIRMYVNPNNGNVGIGNANPSTKLHVTGSARITQDLIMSSSTNTVQFADPVAGNVPMMTMFRTGTSNLSRMVIGHSPANMTTGLRYDDVNDRWEFVDAGNVNLGVNSLGDVNNRGNLTVGGNATLNNTLHVLSNSTLDGTVTANGATSVNSTLGVTGQANLNGGAAVTGVLSVTSSSSSPASFNGASSMYIPFYEGNVYRGYFGSYSGAATDVDFGTGAGNSAGKLHLAIQAVPKLTVDASGNVGIGTTSPSSKLDIDNAGTGRSFAVTARAQGAGQIAEIQVLDTLFSGNDLLALDLNSGQPDDAQIIEATVGGANRFVVQTDGSTGIGGSALTGLGLYVQKGSDSDPTGGGYIVSGVTTGLNISMDDNEIMARNNGAVSPLYLQHSGGDLIMNNGGGSVMIGTTTPGAGYKLSVNGKIIATEVRVETKANWPDYVFGNGYKLMSLDELERKLNYEKHLPGIPSAQEVKENGIMVGEMQTKTMEKVEENTLYILQLNNKLKDLQQSSNQKSQQIDQLNSKIQELEKKLEALAKLIK